LYFDSKIKIIDIYMCSYIFFQKKKKKRKISKKKKKKKKKIKKKKKKEEFLNKINSKKNKCKVQIE